MIFDIPRREQNFSDVLVREPRYLSIVAIGAKTRSLSPGSSDPT